MDAFELSDLAARREATGKPYLEFITVPDLSVGLYVLAAGGAGLLAAVALAWGRIGRYGTYGEFHGGRALPILEVKLGYVLVALVAGVGIAAGYVAMELRRDSRRVRVR